MQRIFLFLLLLCSLYAVGQNSNEKFVSFSTSNGMLKHNSVESFTRDQLGYVWVGTNFGLYRLDGYQTVSFNHDPNDENSLSSNIIKALCTDSDGDVWIGTIGGGLNRFNRNTNQFIRYIPSDTSNSISGINISALLADRDGNIWIGTTGKGVNKYDKKTQTFTAFNLEGYDQLKRTNSNVNALFSDRNGDIWIGQNQSEVFKIDIKTNEVTFFGIGSNDISLISQVGAITGISQLSNGHLLFTTWRGNLYELDPKNDQHLNQIKTPDFFDNNILSSIAVDKQDNMWISTWNDGLYKTKYGTNEKEHIKRDIKRLHSLNSNAINKLYIDDNQHLWICFLDRGLGLLSLKESMIKSLPLKNDEIEYVNAFSILKDKNDNIWVGSRGQGVWKYDLNTKKSASFLYQNTPGLNTNSILILKQSIEGEILVGTDGEFMSIFNPTTNQFKQLPHRIDDWSSAVFALADNEDYIYAGTWGGGIKKIDKKNYQYTSINFDTKDQIRNTIFDLELVDSILWVSNIGLGLIKYNVNNGEYVIYSKSVANPEFPDERITDIFVENKNSLCLSTDGAGLFKFTPSTGTIAPLKIDYGIDNTSIQGVVTDKQNNLWITTSSSVLTINNSTNKVFNFGSNNGLISEQLNKGAIFFDREQNRIYTGCVEGVNFLDPGDIIIDSLVHKVIITQLEIMGKSIHTPNEKNIDTSIDVAKVVNLFYNDKIITFHFSSMELMPSLKSRYYLQLEGFNNDWLELPYSKNFVQYTNLYPGEYMLKVKACNSDGICNKEETRIKIIVHPAFWQTLWFKVIILLFVMLLIFLYINEKYRMLIKTKKELELKIIERTREIVNQKEQIEKQNIDLEMANATKDKFFSIIGHDLRNPLTSIYQLSQLISLQYKTATEERLQQYVELLSKASTNTLNLLDDLLIWARTQTNRLKVDLKSTSLDSILQETYGFSYPIAEKKNIQLNFPAETNMHVIVDKNTILTVLRNLVTNAIKFSPLNSTIELLVLNEDSYVIIKIKDYGIGMSAGELEKLFKIENLSTREGTQGETGTGLGLILCHEFLKLNNGKIWVESEVGVGSTFYIQINQASNGT